MIFQLFAAVHHRRAEIEGAGEIRNPSPREQMNWREYSRSKGAEWPKTWQACWHPFFDDYGNLFPWIRSTMMFHPFGRVCTIRA